MGHTSNCLCVLVCGVYERRLSAAGSDSDDSTAVKLLALLLGDKTSSVGSGAPGEDRGVVSPSPSELGGDGLELQLRLSSRATACGANVSASRSMKASGRCQHSAHKRVGRNRPVVGSRTIMHGSGCRRSLIGADMVADGSGSASSS